MCHYDQDGTHGWNPECPAAGRCLCGTGFPESALRPRDAVVINRQPPRSSMLRTVVHMVLGIGAVLLALIVGVVWLCSPEEERPRRCC
jgi:hypothetical protein